MLTKTQTTIYFFNSDSDSAQSLSYRKLSEETVSETKDVKKAKRA